MDSTVTHLVKTSLSALRRSRADVTIAPFLKTRGAILTLHQVSPDIPTIFAPNRILRITPDFLEATIRHLMETGYEFVALDDIPERIAAAKSDRPFICFTLDDGYKDNLEFACPIFRSYGVPYTIYIPTDYPEGRGQLWWLALEEAIRRLDRIIVSMDGRLRTYELGNATEKSKAFDSLYWWLRGIDETRARAQVAQWCAEAEFDSATLCRDLIMNWDDIAGIARDPLATIGGHTLRHYAVSGLAPGDALAEIRDSMAIVAERTGKPCHHFSFPYGDASAAGERDFAIAKAAGAVTAVTTRKGLIQPGHAETLTALPRLSLNGDYQDLEYLDVLLSGVPFALLDAARKLPFIGTRASA